MSDEPYPITPCCFCGKLDYSGADPTYMTVGTRSEVTKTWWCHIACFENRLPGLPRAVERLRLWIRRRSAFQLIKRLLTTLRCCRQGLLRNIFWMPFSGRAPETALDPLRTFERARDAELAQQALWCLVGRMNSKAFPFHDGYLVSVSVTEHAAVLGLKQAGGNEFVMTLGGIEALSLEGFREGNIILDLWMVSGKHPTSEDLQTIELAELMEILFPGPHPEAAAQYHEKHAAMIETKLDRVRSGQASLVLMTPSYGADLYAFCGSVDLAPPLPALPLR